MDKKNLTPMMRQYLDIKEQNPDSILFFRLGDFYEMFLDDALIASKELEIALTKRDAGLSEKIPMCGVPYHVANTYISKLINKGYKVAICDQVEDPKLTKSIVKREVTKIITPGTFTDTEYLKNDENNFLMSIFIKNYSVDISYSDYSTGELFITNETFISEEKLYSFLRDEIYRIMPSEILINESSKDRINENIDIRLFYVNFYNDEEIKYIELESIREEAMLTSLFQSLEIVKSKRDISINSLKKLIDYLIKTQKSNVHHINKIRFYKNNENLILDENSKKNLELVKGFNTNSKKGSLLEILDKCETSMGSRLLKKWLELPLINLDEILKRQNIIKSFIGNLILQEDILNLLKNVYDISRLSVKISNGSINPREIHSLKESIYCSFKIKERLESSSELSLYNLSKEIEKLDLIYKTIDDILIENPPSIVDESRIIKIGYSNNLDELFDANDKSKEWILDFENEQRELTGIKNLKIKFNKILGYFIEVTKSNLNLVPKNYIRKQTLVGSERFFSMELKEMEDKLLGAKERALSMQDEYFKKLQEFLNDNLIKIQNLADSLAKVDVLISLSLIARLNNYVSPVFNEDGIIDIVDGRHPIVEENFKNEIFVPNDTYLDLDEKMIHIITGPNMAGKSTYMRQVALIVIMAHMGSFVPCSSCNISIVDRIFTRIGASDNLSKGESTFMVEMKEVANITENATRNSLLILDEVGRGTSTFDGMSIAYAIIEYIAKSIGAKTLFATHYHELTSLEEKYKEVDNLTIAVKKKDKEIIFLRKIINGYSNKSYGIDVARLAGINEFIIERSNEILRSLENGNINNKNIKKIDNTKQASIFDIKKDNFIRDIKNIDVNVITPMEALKMLSELQKKAGDIDVNSLT